MKKTANDPRYRPILRVLIEAKGTPISHIEIAEKANFGVMTVKRHLADLRTIGVVYWPDCTGKKRPLVYQVDHTIERLVIAS